MWERNNGIDIFDENNNPIGEIKEKTKAHEDGNFHRTAHRSKRWRNNW